MSHHKSGCTDWPSDIEHTTLNVHRESLPPFWILPEQTIQIVILTVGGNDTIDDINDIVTLEIETWQKCFHTAIIIFITSIIIIMADVILVCANMTQMFTYIVFSHTLTKHRLMIDWSLINWIFSFYRCCLEKCDQMEFWIFFSFFLFWVISERIAITITW